MKKQHSSIMLGALLLLSIPKHSFSETVKGQASMNGYFTGLTDYIDYLYTSEGPVVNSNEAVFHFAYGSAADYDVASTYHYYYQIENIHDLSLVAFSINVYPGSVASVGWIDGMNLDDMNTFDHNNVTGDVEIAWNGSPVSPQSARLNPNGLAPNVSFDFDADSGNRIEPYQQSAVLFISGIQNPSFFFTAMQDAEAFTGKLPAPGLIAETTFGGNPNNAPNIPEPATMMLVSAGAGVLLIRRKR